MPKYKKYRIPILPSNYVSRVIEAIHGAHDLLCNEISGLDSPSFTTAGGDLKMYVSLESASAILRMPMDDIDRWWGLGVLREEEIDGTSYIDLYSILHFITDTQTLGL